MNYPLIQFDNVSLKFKLYSAKGTSLKEALVNRLLKRHYVKEVEKEFLAINSLTLKIASGDRLGIIGDNGAGKSTLLKIITRIYEPTDGNISVNGKVAPLIELGAGFNPELSGYDNIFLNGAIMGIQKNEMSQMVDSIIEFAELDDFIHVPIKYYSTGMYMRLAFTIATEISPEILIVDELFAGGDIHFVRKAEKRIMDLIDSSQIVIMVSHSMDLIKKICNRCVLLERGQLIADGTPADVIEHYKLRGSGTAPTA